MYVDAKPVSGWGETQGWRMPMPSPRPPGSLKRPPLLNKASSSSSSLSGMEQAIPSFQTFVNRTPPPDPAKPLPPTPLIPRRASSASPPRSREPSMYSQRRSSSVYSRTVSQWFDDDSSWRSVDLREDPMPEMPPLPILQPVAYSKSTPQLIERPSAPEPAAMLEPRTYRPLLTTPSPTASRVTTPDQSPVLRPSSYQLEQEQKQQQARQQSPPPIQQPSTPRQLYPTSPPVPETPKKQVATVSLAQAQAAVQSPGAVHLLPEEMRAKAHGRSRSHDIVRVSTLKFFEDPKMSRPPAFPMPPSPPTLVDAQGRHRSLQAQMIDGVSAYPFPVIAPPRIALPESPPLDTQPREESKTKAAEALGIEDDEEPRGRTRQRGPRSMDYSHYMPTRRRSASSKSPDEERNDAQKVASEYHHLLSEQYRQPSNSPGYSSDESIRTHMKMVPQPLFKNKPAAKPPGALSRQDSEAPSTISESPFPLRADSVVSNNSASTRGSLPMLLAVPSASPHRRTSTSGSIPISPPSIATSASPAPTGRSVDSTGSPREEKQRNRSKDDRVSMYYPYVGSRKGKKAQEKKSSAPAMPLLPADVVAQRLKTPNASAESSPQQSTPAFGFKSNTSNRKDSNASSDRQRAPLFQRLAGNAMKYADLVTHPTGLPGAHNKQTRKSSIPTVASQHSPHLLPSPVKNDPPPVHLGWSDTAKDHFDRSRGSTHSTPRTSTQQTTHFTTLPARPLDERYLNEQSPQPSGGRGRKGSIALFGGLLDGWKERKKEEKREELKKIIRVVPQAPPGGMVTRDIVVAPETPPPGVGFGGLTRQASMGTAAAGERSSRGAPAGLQRRMSAFGWM